MKLPSPADSELLVLLEDDDGEDVLYRYQVTSARYNFYSDGEGHWLYFEAGSDVLLAPPDPGNKLNAEPVLRLRIRQSGSTPPVLSRGGAFRTAAYDYDKDAWLATFYHFAHSGLDAELKVIEVSGDEVIATVIGESEDTGPLGLRARFRPDPDLRYE